MRTCLLVLFFASASLANVPAAEPANDVRLPDFPTPPPPPAPSPTDVQKLPTDYLFVVDADTQCAVLCSPAGLVTIAETDGPLRIRARFVGGTGKLETRNFKGKFVYTLEAAAAGRCEIVVVPLGVTNPALILRRTLDVGGVAPLPPVPPGPNPPPVPPFDPLAAVLQTAYAAETAPTKAASVAALAVVYRQSVATANDPTVATANDLYTVVSKAASAAVPMPTLLAMRQAMATEFNARLPTLATDLAKPITSELRALCATQFARMATLLEALR